MYAKLHDKTHTKGQKNHKESSQLPTLTPGMTTINGSSNGAIKLVGARSKNKNLELEKSLMEDDDINDKQQQQHHEDWNGKAEMGLMSEESSVVGKRPSSLMVSDDDPFYVFKEDLQIKLELVDDGLDRFERIVQITVSILFC